MILKFPEISQRKLSNFSEDAFPKIRKTLETIRKIRKNRVRTKSVLTRSQKKHEKNIGLDQRGLEEREVRPLRLHELRVGLRRGGLLLGARLEVLLHVVLHLREDPLDRARLRGVPPGVYFCACCWLTTRAGNKVIFR